MNDVSNVASNVYQISPKAVSTTKNAVYHPVAFKAKAELTEQDKFEKEKKQQKLKSNIMMGISAAASLVVIAYFGKALFGKGGLDSLRSKTEQEALKLKPVDLKAIKERAKDTYSEESQTFLKRFKGLLKRGDIEDKGGKRTTQVILLGPGGTGKTDFAGAAAKEVAEVFPGSEYYVPDLTMLTSSSYKGQSESMLTEYTNALVKRAKELSPKGQKVVVFLDEFDRIAMHDASINAHSSNKTTGALKTLINELMKQDNVILLSATNYPEMIEGAVSSRMAEKVLFDHLTPKQTLTTIVEHYKNSPKKKELISPELLDVDNEKLKEICEIISDKSKGHEMEFRKIFQNILPNTLTKSPENGTIELKHLVEAVTTPGIARDLRLTEAEIQRLKEIVGIAA